MVQILLSLLHCAVFMGLQFLLDVAVIVVLPIRILVAYVDSHYLHGRLVH